MFAIISARPVPIRPCGPSHIGQLRLPQMRNASRTRGARYVRGLRAWIAVMRSLRARSAAHAQTAEGWTVVMRGPGDPMSARCGHSRTRHLVGCGRQAVRGTIRAHE